MTDTTPLEAEATPALEAPAEHLPRPRIRTGAVIWGLLLTVLSGWVLWIAGSPARRADALEAVLTMSPLGWTVLIVVAVGATIALIALAAVIRRLQHRIR